MGCTSCLRSVTVEPVLFLYMFATFMQYSVFQDLVYLKVCLANFNATVCDNLYNANNSEELDKVQSDSSLWILGSTVALAIPSIIAVNLLGSWGDIFGRKIPLIVPSIGGILSSLVYVSMSSVSLSGPVWPIIIASCLSGIFGGFVSCLMAVMSYISSISSHVSRTARVTLLEAMSFVGGTVGPFAGGALLSATNHAVVFAVIGACHFLSVIYVCLNVPQVTTNENDNEDKKICSLSHMKDSVTTCFKPREGNKRQDIVYLLVCCFFIMMTTAGEVDVSYLYVKDKPLQWDYQIYSYYFGTKYALNSLALIVGTPVLKTFNVSDYTICVLGILSKIAGFALLGLSRTVTLMFIVPVAASFSSFCIPALRSLLSKRVESSELGKLFAFVASIEDLCMLTGSLLFNSLYPLMRMFEKGLIFYFAASLQVIPLVIIIWISFTSRSPQYVNLENSS